MLEYKIVLKKIQNTILNLLFYVIVCKNLSVAGVCMPETEVFPHWNKPSETRKQIVNRMRNSEWKQSDLKSYSWD